RDSMAALWAERRANRKTPVPPGRSAPNRKRRPKAKLGGRYTVGSYRTAVQRGCRKAGVPVWHPHQLRHATATEIRREYGIDASRVVLGHRSPAITETYAELDASKAAEVMG